METKKCTKCGEVKGLDEFGINRAMKDGYTLYCKNCTNDIRKFRKGRNSCKIWVRNCDVCGTLFVSRDYQQLRCSYQCAITIIKTKRVSYVRTWRLRHRNKWLTMQRNWHHKHSGRRSAQAIAYQKRHPVVKKEADKRYRIIQRDNITDVYITKLLMDRAHLKTNDIRQYPELIKLKREKIKLYRLIHKKRKHHETTSKKCQCNV